MVPEPGKTGVGKGCPPDAQKHDKPTMGPRLEMPSKEMIEQKDRRQLSERKHQCASKIPGLGWLIYLIALVT